MLQGKGHDPSVEMGDVEALEGVSRFPVRVKCALLPWSTLLEALARPGRRAEAPVSMEAPGGAAGKQGGA